MFSGSGLFAEDRGAIRLGPIVRIPTCSIANSWAIPHGSMPKDRVRDLLASNLKRLRQRRALTGDALAEKSDLTGGFIRQLETQRAWASSKTLDALARALGVSVSELFADRKRG